MTKAPISSKNRLVNVHQAKTHLSRLMDDAHTGETIVLAKAGRSWARLMPLEPTPAQRIPGRLSALGPLLHPKALLEPLSPEELASWDGSSLPQSPSQP
ncbi:type II toxin-antitoxin system Phd/YefM family antitoxin [Synechococcus sp. AH-707-B22]|nr:type II toxin-antitoxin system Phd/YefM family antitoxin [Synechococcus sp. AH-707-B22]